MEAKNMTTQDYVGKTIIVGDNIANIVIKSADGNKLQGEFSRDNMPNMSMTIYMDKLQEYLANGTWKVKSDQQPTATNQEPTATNQQPRTKAAIKREESDARISSSEREQARNKVSTTANPEPLTDNHEPEQEDPVIAQWKALKEKNADAMIIFRKDKVYVIVADDATKASQVAGLQVSQQGDVPICVFPTGDLSGIMCDLVKNGVRVVICDLVEEPTATAQRSTARQRVQPKFVKPETSEENPSSDPEECEEEEPTHTDQEPTPTDQEPTARQRVQPKTVRSEVTLEAEKGSAKIIDNGKSIIVAGDTQKIEAVLLTLWGRKRPYTRNGKMYSGIVLSAKHKATVKEIIKLATAC